MHQLHTPVFCGFCYSARFGVEAALGTVCTPSLISSHVKPVKSREVKAPSQCRPHSAQHPIAMLNEQETLQIKGHNLLLDTVDIAIDICW